MADTKAGLVLCVWFPERHILGRSHLHFREGHTLARSLTITWSGYDRLWMDTGTEEIFLNYSSSRLTLLAKIRIIILPYL